MYHTSLSQAKFEDQQEASDSLFTALVEQFVDEIEDGQHDATLLEHFVASGKSETKEQIIESLAEFMAKEKHKELLCLKYQ